MKNAIDGRQGARALEGLEAGALKVASLRTAAAFRGAADLDRACAQPHGCRGVMADRLGSHPVWEYDECPVTLFKNSATRSASCGADRSFLLPAADPITGDTRAGVFDGPSNVVFVPALQYYKAKMFILVQSSRPQALVEPLRGAMRSIDDRVPMYRPATLEDRFLTWAAPARAARVLMVTVGATALVIAMLGIFGVHD